MSREKQIINGLQTTLGKMELAFGAIQEAILWTNLEGTILWCNKAFDKLLSRPHISLLGAKVFDVFPLEKDGLPVSLDQHPYKQLDENRSLTDNIFVFKRTNKSISVEISGSKSELGSSGTIVILTIRNITPLLASREEIKKAKNTLEVRVKERTNELLILSNKYKSILSEAVEAIVTIDHRGIMQSFNPAAEKIFGYTENEVVGENVNILMPSPNHENHDQFLQNYLTSGTKKIIGIGREVIGKRRNGQAVPLDLAVSETRTGSNIFFTGIMRDISARKEAEAALEKAKYEAEQANKVKSDFLARMSHEIRTPMNAILGMAELLQETSLNSEQEQYIDIFRGAGQHLLSIINDLLDLEKIESDQFKLEAVDFDLHKLFSETYEIMAAAADKKGIGLEYTIAPETPAEVLGDPVRLKQILINIVGNAIKFTDKGAVSFHVRQGAVEISEKDSSERVELLFEVNDTGLGIEEVERETIFESFTQADHSITRKYGGTGLGLAISRKLIRQMDGDISVSSRLHKGSTFTFNGWFSPGGWGGVNTGEDTVSPTNGPESYTPSGPVSILLADDSPDNRFLFKAFLKQLDCSLEFADNGMIAFQKFKSSQYNLVLMDIQMPVLDGYSATKLIRSHEEQNNLVPTPIIALTAHALKSEKEKSLQVGCDMHITKPVSKKELLTAICSLLDKNSHPVNRAGDTIIAKTTVHIDKILEDLIPGFLDNRRTDIDALRDAVEKGDMTIVENLGHTMKGTGGGYGFQKITELGDALERAARQKDGGRILHLAEELENYLDNLEVVIVE